jgi:CubicO group peptidase (beta-lactamase class C family)
MHQHLPMTIHIKKSILPLLLSVSFFSCSQQHPKDVIGDYHRKGHFNGAVLIAKKDRVICDTILGYSDFTTKTNLTKEARFYIASLSKPITATAIMLLQQKQLLSYDEKAIRYLPGLPAYAQQVTIRQLLNHTSGIKDYEQALAGKKGLTNRDIVMWLHEQRALNFEPGSQFDYSNSGYILLSLIIEQVSKQSYRQFLHDSIFTPLQMNHTTVYDETKPMIKNKAVGFNQDKQPDDYSILTTGDGGIYSTVGNLYTFHQSFHGLLSKENLELMYQPPLLKDGKRSAYGFGWFVEGTDKHRIVQHTGGLNGFRALFWRDLSHHATIIALTNQGDAFPLHQFLQDVKSSLPE